jgi:hypothetical protein
VIALPPLEAGAVQEIVDWPFWLLAAVTLVGAPGTDVVDGVNALDVAELPVPFELIALTRAV